MKQFTFLQEGSNWILSKVQKSFWSCTHVNSCLKIYTTYQSTYFIDDFNQGVIKNPKITEIQQVQQKICTEQVFNVGNNLLLRHIAFKSEATRIYR